MELSPQLVEAAVDLARPVLPSSPGKPKVSVDAVMELIAEVGEGDAAKPWQQSAQCRTATGQEFPKNHRHQLVRKNLESTGWLQQNQRRLQILLRSKLHRDAPERALSGCGRLRPQRKDQSPYNFTGVIRLAPEALNEPLKVKTGCGYSVNSLSDLFHKDVPEWFIDAVFDVMERATWHSFQVLTKRPAANGVVYK